MNLRKGGGNTVLGNVQTNKLDLVHKSSLNLKINQTIDTVLLKIN